MKMKDKKIAAGNQENQEAVSLETLFRLIWQEPKLRKIIRKNCGLDTERIGLIYKIVLGTGQRKKEDIVGELYRYGSMVKEQDLIARQFFLWLTMVLWDTENE